MTFHIAGDVGGTKTVLALYSVRKNKMIELQKEYYDSKRFKTFGAAVKNFLRATDVPKVSSACFGIAGPVIKNKVKTTNLPWTIDGGKLSKETGIRNIALINDFKAVSLGIPLLRPRDLGRLNKAKPTSFTNKAVIGAGTGLGQGALIWHGVHYVPVSSEGGHGDFAAKTKVDWELAAHLTKKCKHHPDWESVVSGPGLVNIYNFLKTKKVAKESTTVKTAMKKDDPAAVITKYATKDPLCKRAMELFVRYYGREAGNLALKVKALGGVYLAGGIAAKVIKFLRKKEFMDEFSNKGKLKPFMKKMPVYVVLNPDVGLLGAANFARQML